jgi:chromosome partitioning protein
VNPEPVAALELDRASITAGRTPPNPSELLASERMKTLLSNLSHGPFDWIVIDTPPTLGLITVNALVASTHVLIPIQSSYFALEGTDDLLEATYSASLV